MADAGKHDGALLDMALDAVAHLDEGVGGLAHLARAARAEIVRRRAPLAKAFGSFGQAQDRLDLVAQEKNRHGEQDERSADHPYQEDLGVGGVGLTAAGKDMHHPVVELDADVDEIGAAHRVDPEGTADLARQLVGERGVEKVEEGPGVGFGQLLSGLEADTQAEIGIGEPDQGLGVRVLGKVAVDVDQHGDVLHGDRGQAARHHLPMALEEHEGHHRLEQHHRRDDDDQRARIEAFRHLVADRARDAAIERAALVRKGRGVGDGVHHSGYKM